MKKRIIVVYWHENHSLSKPVMDVGIAHLTEYDFSTEKRNELIDMIMGKGYSIMLRPIINVDYPDNDAGIYLWIDKGRFGQK